MISGRSGVKRKATEKPRAPTPIIVIALFLSNPRIKLDGPIILNEMLHNMKAKNVIYFLWNF
jgi:hypothetical protein